VTPARVIVVAGPSGSGKSRLCRRLRETLGVPVVNLDDFYKNGDDPTLPRVHLAPGREIVDWDDPRSWSRDEALDALETLCRDGAVELPVYDIAHDGRVGTTSAELGGSSYVVAEGLFAQEVVPGCRERGLIADAVCVHNPRLVTFWRRLSRDLRERRKPPWVLVRRGWLLMRAEPDVVAHAVACGCVPVNPHQAYERLARLITGAPSRAR
jgi:uridine kinase